MRRRFLGLDADAFNAAVLPQGGHGQTDPAEVDLVAHHRWLSEVVERPFRERLVEFVILDREAVKSCHISNLSRAEQSKISKCLSFGNRIGLVG